MPNLEHAYCHNGKKTANNRHQVEKLFGFRVMSGKYKYVQSWCKACRSL